MRGTLFAVALCLSVSLKGATGQIAKNDPPVSIGDSLAGAAAAQTPALQTRGARYRLRGGDSFEVDFALSPSFNETAAVQPDGYVSLKGAQSIHVEGLTVPEMEAAIKSAYATILRDPIVVVSLKEFEPPYFIIGGKVGKPGKYELRTSLTLYQAVAIAGGFTEDSKHSQVVLFRPMPNGMFESTLINEKRMLAKHELTEDPRLQPGDTIYVPQNALSKIRRYLPSSTIGAYLNNLTF